jgi:hypothetical protein
MSVQDTYSALPSDMSGFFFSLTALVLFVTCAFAGLLLAYGVAAPTGRAASMQPPCCQGAGSGGGLFASKLATRLLAGACTESLTARGPSCAL